MPKALKWNALGMFAIAVAFCLFFQISKHNPVLSGVNPFAEDPYDAIGSFGVQFVLFIALLSLIRAFRQYPPDTPLRAQEILLARGQLMGFSAVAVTVVADAIAMIRYPSMWLGTRGGYVLLILAGGLLLWATMAGCLPLRSARALSPSSMHYTWTKLILVPFATILVLVLYPEAWRHSFFGALFTVVVGVGLLFVPVWALGTAAIPISGETYFDSIDDISAVYRAHILPIRFLRPISVSLERLLQSPPMPALFDWFSPRQHRWSLTALVGILIGVFLFFGELSEGGGPPRLRRLFVVAAVYIGLESVGVLAGCALLAKPLGLFRPSASKA